MRMRSPYAYNRLLLTAAQRDCLDIVLVSPRNPLNIGAVARAMANFGFAHLTVAAPYAPNWREAKSAVGAPELLAGAREAATVADAVAQCTFVVGTGTLTYRKPEQEVLQLQDLAPRMQRAVASGGRAALVFGPEKHGLTRDDLAWCHALVEIPTDPRQPSMNLGQAAAVCLYELSRPGAASTSSTDVRQEDVEAAGGRDAAQSSALDRLAGLIEEAMAAADYSPAAMRAANQYDLRLLLRRLHFSAHDTRRAMGLFRRIVWGLQRKGSSLRKD